MASETQAPATAPGDAGLVASAQFLDGLSSVSAAQSDMAYAGFAALEGYSSHEAAAPVSEPFTAPPDSLDQRLEAPEPESHWVGPSYQDVNAAAINQFMQTTLRERVRNNPDNPKPWEPANWDNQPLVAPRNDPYRDAAIAAYAAEGLPYPYKEEDSILAAMAAGPFGFRNGKSVQGATQRLGYIEGDLPPLRPELSDITWRQR